MAGNSPPGWDWCRGSIPPAAKPNYWGSVNAGICTCARLLIHGARSSRPCSAARAPAMMAGRVSCSGATRTSRLWPWRTKTRALSGRCSPMDVPSSPIIAASEPGSLSQALNRHNGLLSNSHPRIAQAIIQSDGITGQTGVDSTYKATGTSTVRAADEASTSTFHQGPRARLAHTGRMYGCNLYL